jgi:stearoyl-CoA desaturase (delta-9 desaturase)
LHWLAGLTSGEGYHNNHHELPTSARFGFKRFDLDAAWWLVKLAERCGLAHIRELKSKASLA